MKRDNKGINGAGASKNEEAYSLGHNFEQMCEMEGLSHAEAEAWLNGLMDDTEKQINNYRPKTNHLTVLNRQLRGAAAVFLLIVSGGLLMSCVKTFHFPTNDNSTYYGPYELASGNKLVP